MKPKIEAGQVWVTPKYSQNRITITQIVASMVHFEFTGYDALYKLNYTKDYRICSLIDFRSWAKRADAFIKISPSKIWKELNEP
jgi:hypothetical protein